MSYKIKADENNEAVLRDSINTLLIHGYVDLSAYEAQDYDDDDEDETDSKDCEEGASDDKGAENKTLTKKNSFFSQFK